MWTHQREENYASTGLSLVLSPCIHSSAHQGTAGPRAMRLQDLRVGGPAPASWGSKGAWTAQVVTRPVPTHFPYTWVTVAQRWTERPGPLAVLPDRGPRRPAAPNHCLSGTRWKLVAWQGPLFCRESRPGPQAPSFGTALGSDGQVHKWTDGRTASCGWGPGSVCLVSPSWWARPRVCALSCHATSHVFTLGPPLPPLPGNSL